MKPKDWLVDYSTAVSIANGNKRVAVKYVPLMLQGTARTWLNSLKPRARKRDDSGKETKRPWNANLLRIFYS